MRALLVASLAVSVATLASARAATVDTFNFQQAGYVTGLAAPLEERPLPAGVPLPLLVMTGSFTGTVEPSGIIGQADLTGFSMTDNGGLFGNAFPIFWGLVDLQFFSFNTNGGNSTLGLIVNLGVVPAAGLPAIVDACIGAPAALSPMCNPPGTPAGDLGIEIKLGPFATSTTQPSVTLVSSVTTPPPATPAAVPEPASLRVGA